MAEVSDWRPWGIPLIIIAVILILVAIMWLIRWYVRFGWYNGTGSIHGKTVVITGGNTGIGKETAKLLIQRGGRVIMLCRNTEKGREASEDIARQTGSKPEVRECDLASMVSIRACAEALKQEEPQIDVLINNAGVMLTPKMETADGFEMQLGTNHLGHFLLTLLLLAPLKKAAPSRIVTVSSLAHAFGAIHWDDLNSKKSYDSTKAYSQSKLANILFTKALAEKLKGTGVSCYAVHPGVVQTELGRHVGDSLGRPAEVVLAALRPFYKTSEQGAQTSLYCAVEADIAEHSGRYYSGCREKSPSRSASNTADAERLWRTSLELTNMQDANL